MEDSAYYRPVLHGLIDAGADLAQLVHEQARRGAARAEATPPVAIGPEVGVTFDRLARTVRRCIVLARRLDDPVAHAGSSRVAARRRIIRAVEDAIEYEGKGDKAESLHAGFLERLDAPDVDEDIIADICHDLGLATLPGLRLWKRRMPADIAVLCERAQGRGGRELRPRRGEEDGLLFLKKKKQKDFCRLPDKPGYAGT